MSTPRRIPANSADLPFQLRISPRRRSVGLTITVTGELVVHAPKNLPRKALQEIVGKHQAWIARKQAERQAAWDRLEKGKVYYRGQALALKLSQSGPAGVHLRNGALQVNLVPEPRSAKTSLQTEVRLIETAWRGNAVPPFSEGGLGGIGPEAAFRDPWPLLLCWYRRQAETILTEQVRQFAPRLGLAPPPLELRAWRRRWGECHPDGRLRFNWRLVLLPPESLDYLVVHELAHLLVPGHSRRFWQEVGKHLPDHADRRRWLRLYGSPFLVWRFEPS
jgi:predicted metal-dependent hydrolase|uniref:M48 family peptidase n=1 Tax=Desulfobacca acetoxidans TaxID=60893 RepID=A0A7C3V6F0_9BACT